MARLQETLSQAEAQRRKLEQDHKEVVDRLEDDVNELEERLAAKTSEYDLLVQTIHSVIPRSARQSNPTGSAQLGATDPH